MKDVRKLRNLAKLRPVFGQLCDRFMFAGCLLLKKGLILNENAIESLKNGYNAFELPEFTKFLASDDKAKILKNFEEDQKIYSTFSQQMTSKFAEEVTSTEYKQEMSRFKSLTFQKMATLDEEMHKHFKFFKDKINFLNLPADIEAEYCLAIVHFYYSIFSEESFPLTQQGKIFEWKNFEANTKSENAKNILKTL